MLRPLASNMLKITRLPQPVTLFPPNKQACFISQDVHVLHMQLEIPYRDNASQ